MPGIKHIKNISNLTIMVMLALWGQSCDVYNDTGYERQYIVESYLVANATLSPVRVSHTVPSDQSYSFSGTAVTGAEVSVALLDRQGNVEERVTYGERDDGVYYPAGRMVVKPRRTYRLVADINENQTISTTTTVPNSYRLTGSVPDSAVYQSDEQIQVTLVPDAPDTLRGQKQFVFNLISTEYQTAPMTPFYADQIDGEDITRLDFRNNSSGLVSEGNFTVNSDGSINIWVPWIGFAFFGENLIVTNSIDNNLYDFIRSQGVQTSGSTLSPGEIPNVIYHVDGGIGVFGSMTTDTVSTYLTGN